MNAHFVEPMLSAIPSQGNTTVRLGDVCSLITKGTTPNSDQGSFSNSGVTYIKSECLTYDGYLKLDAATFITPATHLALKRSHLQEGDILYSIAGANLGKCCIVPATLLPANTNQAVAIIRVDDQLADPRFVGYFLRDSRFVREVLSRVAQSAQPNVNLADIGRFELPNFAISEQRAIAHVLGTLDDKIGLNRLMTETLEAISRALFKSWFIDFDPVEAAESGHSTHLAPLLAALFPKRLVDSNLGQTPEGWITMSLSEILQESNERVGKLDAPEYSSTNSGLRLRSERFSKSLSRSSEKNKLIRRGYLVFGLSRSVLNFGLMRDEIGSVSSAYKVYRINGDLMFPDLLERLMRLNESYFYKAVSASSREGQSVSTDGLDALHFVCPPSGVQHAFDKIDAPLASRIRALRNESRMLTSARDALLPKLMYGELRVTEAERLLEKSA